MKYAIKDIKAKLIKGAEEFVSRSEAAEFARLMIQQHLQKAPRINSLQEAVDDLAAWAKIQAHSNDREPIIAAEKPGFAIHDFQGLPPSLKVGAVHNDLEKRARENGVALSGLRNTGGIIILNMWAAGLADRGLVGLAMFNGGSESVVPFGGTRGFFGTNPMAYAIPTATRPMILDMATSEIPYFQIKQAYEKGESLPPGTAVDDNGRPTTDAAQAFFPQADENVFDSTANLLPLGGGFKGYGLMMMVEVFTGALVGSMMSNTQSHGWSPNEYGCFLLAIDPGLANTGGKTGADKFAAAMTTLAEDLRSQKSREDMDSVPVPGDRGWAKLDAALAAGKIELDDELGRKLMALGE